MRGFIKFTSKFTVLYLLEKGINMSTWNIKWISNKIWYFVREFTRKRKNQINFAEKNRSFNQIDSSVPCFSRCFQYKGAEDVLSSLIFFHSWLRKCRLNVNKIKKRIRWIAFTILIQRKCFWFQTSDVLYVYITKKNTGLYMYDEMWTSCLVLWYLHRRTRKLLKNTEDLKEV